MGTNLKSKEITFKKKGALFNPWIVFCSYLHEVLLHVVGQEIRYLLLVVQLLRQGIGREGEALILGQGVVDSPV